MLVVRPPNLLNQQSMRAKVNQISVELFEGATVEDAARRYLATKGLPQSLLWRMKVLDAHGHLTIFMRHYSRTPDIRLVPIVETT